MTLETDALRRIAAKQQEALEVIRSNGFVFTSIGQEPGNWQHLAFTLYNEICEIDVIARAGLGLTVGDDVGEWVMPTPSMEATPPDSWGGNPT